MTEQALKKLLLIWRKNPVIFARQVLKFEPDEWQIKTLNHIRDSPFVAVASGQGVGKTSLEAVIILWFLTCFDHSRIVCTAPTQQQLVDVLWSELAKWHQGSILEGIVQWYKTRITMIGAEAQWFATIRTATRPENMQGFHADNLLYIVEEASGVKDDIIEAIRGSLSGKNNKLLMMSNPTQLSGAFYEAFHGEAYNWVTQRVSASDSPRTNKQNITSLIKRYGKDSDVVRVRVEGLFPRGSSDSLIDLELVEGAFNSQVNQSQINDHDILHIGVDVARLGADRTVLAPRILNYYFPAETYERQRTTVTASRVLQMIETYRHEFPNLNCVYVKVDDTGVGGGVTDRLIELVDEVLYQSQIEMIVVPVNNGSRGSDPMHYVNLGAQLWGDLRELLVDNLSQFIQGEPSLIKLPVDEELKAQLTNRKFGYKSDNRLFLESKEQLASRGVKSPDYADAVMLAMYEPPLGQVTLTDRY